MTEDRTFWKTILTSILKIEHAAIFIAATVAYVLVGGSWWLYAVLFFTPDISFAAYLAGPRFGAIIYNALHSWVGPAILLTFSLWLDLPMGNAVALIWIAHIGFDRMLGYGLKHTSDFRDTHLGRIGRQ